MKTLVLSNTTTTTTGAHPVTPKTTSKRKNTSRPLAFTSTTSTSRMESATRSTYHNHVYQHLQFSMVLHLHSQNGLVNFEHTSTSVCLSTSTYGTSPTTRKYHLQQTSWCNRRACQDLRDERALLPGDPQFQENAVIDNEI